MDGFRLYSKHVNPVFAQLLEMTGMNPEFVRAEGCRIIDKKGNEYLDFLSGYGTFNLGHNHPEIVECVSGKARENLLQVYGSEASPYMGELAEKLVSAAGAPFEICFFSNSGTEAVEGALKIARAATGRSKMAYCRNAYHGTTLGSLSMMGDGPVREPFGPLLPGFTALPFGDAVALEEAMSSGDYAAFVTEPVQAEGGVNIPVDGYLKTAAAICRQYGALFILDEVQTGMGRTGTLFAFQGEDVTPDVLTVAKSLGGGIMPIGAYVTTREVYERAYGTYELCSAHHSTFGGCSLACCAAMRALNIANNEKFLRNVDENGTYLMSSLKETVGRSALVKEIRGRGLLIGVEFGPLDNPQLQWENLGMPDFEGRTMSALLVARYLLGRKILAQVYGHNWNVLRVEPPLVMGRGDMDIFVKEAAGAVEWLKSIA